MQVSHISDYQNIQRAIKEINKKYYQGNVKLNSDGITSLNANRTRVKFRLVVYSLDLPGHRVHKNTTGHRSRYACWHVHGHFFDALLALEPEAIIRSGSLKIGIEFGKIRNNWIDKNLGSEVYPFMYSQSCDCEV